MRFSAIAVAVAVPAFASAAVQTIKVGSDGQLAYDPPSMVAALGDTVQFVFEAKNHSVTQSTFTDPCTRSNVNNTQGFTSGFNFIAADSSSFPTFEINVTQAAPIWFYCGQTIPVNHCQMGMVGVINPTADKTIDMFKAAAMGGNSSAPAQSGTASGSPSDTASGAAPSNSSPANTVSSPGSPSASQTSGSPSDTSSASAPTNSNGAMRMSSGAAGLLTLVGIVAGVTL